MKTIIKKVLDSITEAGLGGFFVYVGYEGFQQIISFPNTNNMSETFFVVLLVIIFWLSSFYHFKAVYAKWAAHLTIKRLERKNDALKDELYEALTTPFASEGTHEYGVDKNE